MSPHRVRAPVGVAPEGAAAEGPDNTTPRTPSPLTRTTTTVMPQPRTTTHTRRPLVTNLSLWLGVLVTMLALAGSPATVVAQTPEPSVDELETDAPSEEVESEATEAQEVGDAEDEEQDNGRTFFGISVEGEVEAAFFAHEPFGFGLYTFDTLTNDALFWSARIYEWFEGYGDATTGEAVKRTLPWVVLLVLWGLALFYDVRVRRWFRAFAAKIELDRSNDRAWIVATRRTLFRTLGRLVVPTALWMFSYVPLQGLFASAPWTRALSDVIGLFIVYRVLATVVQELFTGDFFEIPKVTGERLRRAFVLSLRLVFVFYALTTFTESIAYREDVTNLSRTLFRTSVTLLSLRFFYLKPELIALLPIEGSKRYLRFRHFAESYLRYVLTYSLILLTLWTLGFRRAASTVLLRGYGIIGLIVAGALLQRWFDRKVRAIDPKSQELTIVEEILLQIDGFARFCIYVVFGVALLHLLGLYEPLITLLTALRIFIGETPITLFNVIKGITFIASGILASRVLRILLDRVVYPGLEVDTGAGYALSTALHYFLIVVSTGLALVTIGLDLSAMAVFAGALGVGIGFGLQDMARNLISGFTLLFGRSVEKGDLITVNNDYVGYVEAVGARAVTVSTPDNYEMVIPCSDLINSTIINWTHRDPWVRIHVPIGVSYNADLAVVREALIAAAKEFPHSSNQFEADVWLVGFGNSAVELELLVWVDARHIVPSAVRGRLLFYVWDAFKERDIEIPFPQRDIHIKSTPSTEGLHFAVGGTIPPTRMEKPQQRATTAKQGAPAVTQSLATRDENMAKLSLERAAIAEAERRKQLGLDDEDEDITDEKPRDETGRARTRPHATPEDGAADASPVVEDSRDPDGA